MPLRRRVPLKKMIESRHMPIRKELEASLFENAVRLCDYRMCSSYPARNDPEIRRI
jgi:hypothetical protein